jgi:Tfp pilus assembly protein PilF
LVKRGRAKLLNNNNIGSFSDFSKAIEIAPKNFKAAFEIAKFYLDQGEVDNAKLWGEKALEINPTSAKAQYLISLCERHK